MQPVQTTAIHKPITRIKHGAKAGLPIAVGYMPIALAFGLLAKTHGLTLMETTLMSLIVFAGAAQFMALQMLALGTGAMEIVLTTFMVNIRHFLMSASINERAESDHPFKKIIYAFGITDETFSVASMYKGSITTGFMYGLILVAYGSWVLSTFLGFVVGANLPNVLQESMTIALYAMFIGLAVPALKISRKATCIFLTAAIANTLLSIPLSSGWSIVLSTIIAAVAVEWIWQKGENHE